MLRNFCDSPIHKWLSLSLAFIFFFFIMLAIPAGAVDPSPSPSPIRPNEPIGWKDGDTFRDIMLVVLDSWGISFSKSDTDDDTSILELSDQLMQEFYEANQTTQELFWDLVKYGVDQTGNIILDFLGVNKIRQFANWLKDKFSLTDNSSVNTVAPTSYAYVNGVKCLVIYSPTQVFYVNYASPNSNFVPTPMNLVVTDNGNSNPYPIFLTTYIDSRHPDHSIPAVYFTGTSKGVTFRKAATNESTYIAFNSSVARKGEVWDYSRAMSLPDIIPLVFDSTPNVNTLFGDGTVTYDPSPSSLIINTTIINIPSEDLDPDDGLQIEIPGSNWGDSIYDILNLIERLIGLYDNTQLEIVSIVDTLETLIANLQRSVTVENIPGAVTLDYDDYDIPLETEWGLIDDFYGLEFSEDDTLFTPFDTLKSLIFGLPEPLILFLSVMIVWIVAYGFIRMGRDSH